MKRLLPEMAILILIVLIVVPLMPSVMRESDQASVLRGAFDIAFRGASVFPAYFYHYDKIVMAAIWYSPPFSSCCQESIQSRAQIYPSFSYGRLPLQFLYIEAQSF